MFKGPREEKNGRRFSIIIETERLILREMIQEDLDSLREILQDEETMVAYEGAFTDKKRENGLIGNGPFIAKKGYGLWAVILKENGAMIGQCGLTMQAWKDQRVLEIGYLFNRSYWHQGYATEAAKARKEYAFKVLKAPEVCSIIRDTNIASQNVAIRNGMKKKDTWTKHYRGVDMPHSRFVASRD